MRLLVSMFLLAGLSGSALGQTREETLAAFKKMQANSQQALKGANTRSIGSAVPGATGQARVIDSDSARRTVKEVSLNARTTASNIVKVWIELIDGADRGKKVNFAERTWGQGEGFRLAFETAVPVYVALNEIKPDGSTVPILPSDKNTKSFETVTPGAPFVLPVDLETNRDNKDERLALTLKFVGSPDAPAPPSNNDKQFSTRSIQTHIERMNSAFQATRGANKALPALRPTVRNATDIDDLATLVIMKEHTGTVELLLRKK